MHKVLLIGNGAREHVLAETIIRSPQEVELYSFMAANNPGITKLSTKTEIGNLSDTAAITRFAKENNIDFAIIGPEAPLAAGVVDELEKAGIKSVGPKKSLARLETSKSFTRDLCVKYGIDCYPKFKVFKSSDGIKEFMEELEGQFVVKADGLKGGKGVKVVGDHLEGIDDGLKYAEECLNDGGMVIVEEKLVGEEYSLQCLTDGKTVITSIPVQDHKRAYEGDKGPNTGGMGSYSTANQILPFMTEKDAIEGYEITKKVCQALKQECGEEYKGVMYGGFIITKNGIKLIEYNARFGDPEAMNVLPILKTDFIEICKAIIEGTLDKIDIEFGRMATVCKYAVPEGYPEKPVKGKEIDLSDVGEDAKVYYAAVDENEGKLYMSSSRAVAFVGIAKNLLEAENIAETAVSNVKGPVFHRKDIGTHDLINKRIEHMKQLRG